MKQLENAINQTQSKHLNNPSEQLYKEVIELRAKYNVISVNRATKTLLRLKQSYYEQGEMASKLLAWRIKQSDSERAINTIEMHNVETSDFKEINNVFKTFL